MNRKRIQNTAIGVSCIIGGIVLSMIFITLIPVACFVLLLVVAMWVLTGLIDPDTEEDD